MSIKLGLLGLLRLLRLSWLLVLVRVWRLLVVCLLTHSRSLVLLGSVGLGRAIISSAIPAKSGGLRRRMALVIAAHGQTRPHGAKANKGNDTCHVRSAISSNDDAIPVSLQLVRPPRIATTL
jgi:hypothetical protein